MAIRIEHVDPTRVPSRFGRAYAANRHHLRRQVRVAARQLEARPAPVAAHTGPARHDAGVSNRPARDAGCADRGTTTPRDHLLPRRGSRHDRCVECRGITASRLVLQPPSRSARDVRWDADAGSRGGRRGRTRSVVDPRRSGLSGLCHVSTGRGRGTSVDPAHPTHTTSAVGTRHSRDRRTVVVTSTIDGCRVVELKPNRTGGSTSRTSPMSLSFHSPLIPVTRWRSVAA